MAGPKLWLPETDPLDKYRTPHRTDIRSADFCNGGFTSVRVLPEYIDCKMDMAIISLLAALGAKTIRISRGEVTSDASMGTRATVIVDEDDYIQTIEMEIHFSAPKDMENGSGYALQERLRSLKRPWRDTVKPGEPEVEFEPEDDR